jgi:AcrR family transcriptional regulator
LTKQIYRDIIITNVRYIRGLFLKTDIRSAILRKSVKIFSDKGYYGTSMRAIAKAVSCSLPTLYYHFKSKGDLFEEVAANEFLRLHKRMGEQLELSADPWAVYSQGVINVKRLSPYDKAVFTIALKVALGFEKVERIRAKILRWENDRVAAGVKYLQGSRHGKQVNPDFVALLVNTAEHLIQKIVLLEENIPDETIKRQFELLFRLMS